MSQLRDAIGSSVYQFGTQILPMISLKSSQNEPQVVQDDVQNKCKYIKREGESCTLNNNCTYPNCTPQRTK